MQSRGGLKNRPVRLTNANEYIRKTRRAAAKYWCTLALLPLSVQPLMIPPSFALHLLLPHSRPKNKRYAMGRPQYRQNLLRALVTQKSRYAPQRYGLRLLVYGVSTSAKYVRASVYTPPATQYETPAYPPSARAVHPSARIASNSSLTPGQL